MLKVYYCENCNKIQYIQYESNALCRWCSNPIIKINIPFEKFANLDISERKALINKIINENIY